MRTASRPKRRLLPKLVRALFWGLAWGWAANRVIGLLRRIGPLGRPGAKAWTQFHADGPSQGSLFVATDFALRARWSVDVGPVVFSSPVIGPDGTIYVANLSGELIAVSPGGTIQWRATFGLPITSSPAVDEQGRIYVALTSVLPDKKLLGSLAVVDPSGAVLRLRLLPEEGFTSSSPKVVSVNGNTYVFLYTRFPLRTTSRRDSALLVFDASGDLVGRKDLSCSLGPLTGGSPLIDGLLQFLSNPFPGFDPTIGELYERFGWLDPTVAVVSGDDLPPPRDQPMVVVVNQDCSVHAFRWNRPDLEEVWSIPRKELLASSPAVVNGASIVVFGTAEGQVLAHDVRTGAQLWEHTVGKKELIMGTPASLGGLIYVASYGRLQALDPGTGAPIYQVELSGKTLASPALSGSNVYASTDAALHSLSLNFQNRSQSFDSAGGLSTPAIGKDGSVYTIVARFLLTPRSTLLRAYAGP